MIDGITPLHLILILAIALIVIGPGKLPSVGKALGESLREFRDSVRDVKEATTLEPVAPAPVASQTPPTATIAREIAPPTAPPQASALADPEAPPAGDVASQE
jgi:TatA/E family protein of Tat protein translocase